MRPRTPLPTTFVLALALLASLAASPAVAAGGRTLEASLPLPAGHGVHIELDVAELRVEGAEAEGVEIELRLDCQWGKRRCEEAIEKLAVTSYTAGDRLHLELDHDLGWLEGKIEVDGVLAVPAGAALHVEVGVGEVEVRGLSADVRVELGVGEATVRALRDAVREVRLDAGVGEVEIYGADGREEGRRSLLVGSEAVWREGDGTAEIDVEVGVGEATVFLD